MSYSVLLFKDFNTGLPEKFISQLSKECPEAIIHTVRGVTDFNRWDLSLRYHPRVVDVFNKVNKENGNILSMFLYTKKVDDVLSGLIAVDYSGKEFWDEK